MDLGLVEVPGSIEVIWTSDQFSELAGRWDYEGTWTEKGDPNFHCVLGIVIFDAATFPSCFGCHKLLKIRKISEHSQENIKMACNESKSQNAPNILLKHSFVL